MITTFCKRLDECCYLSRSNFIALLDHLQLSIEEIVVSLCVDDHDEKKLRISIWELADFMYDANIWRCSLYVTEHDYRKHLFGPLSYSFQDALNRMTDLAKQHYPELSELQLRRITYDAYHYYIKLLCASIDILMDYTRVTSKKEWVQILTDVFTQ